MAEQPIARYLHAMIRDRDFTAATRPQLDAVLAGSWVATVKNAAREELERRAAASTDEGEQP